MFSQFDNEEMENYFNGLNAQLKRMPAADRAEAHQELRQHLDALIAAHEELGATPQEATEAAIRQLGDPVKMGRKLFQEWQLSRCGHALSTFVPILCASALLFTVTIGCASTPVHRGTPEWFCDVFIFGIPPIVTGSVIGLFRPGAAIRNVAQASLAVSGIGIVLSLPNFSRDLAHIVSQFAYGIQHTAQGIYWMGQWSDDAATAARSLAMTLFGVLPGVCAAYLMSSWRRGGFYRVQASDLKLRARH